MAPRRGARSLKQAAQNSLTRFIFLKEIPAEILNGAPTHLAVAIMIQVTDEIERTNKVAIARGSAMLKQKQCQLNIAEHQLTAISRVFGRIWRMLTQPERSLNVQALNCFYNMTWDENENKPNAMKQISIYTPRGRWHDPSLFLEEPVSKWGVESWVLSSDQPTEPRRDFMVGQTLYDGRTGRKVTDPFL